MEKKLKCWIDIASKVVAIIIGIFAFWQFHESQQSDRRQVAIEAVAHVKTKEILESLVRLEENYERNTLDYDGVERDLAHVMSWYDHLGLLYLNDGQANKCIIQGAVIPYAESIQKILNALQYPRERRMNFDLLVNKIHDEAC